MARPDEVNAVHVMKLGQSTALMLCKLKTNHRVYERAADGTELGPFNTLEGHFISSSGGPVSDHSNGLAVFRQGEPSAGYFPGISTSAVSISAIWTFFGIPLGTRRYLLDNQGFWGCSFCCKHYVSVRHREENRGENVVKLFQRRCH